VRARGVVVLLVAALVAAVCVRLGLWQLDRLHAKQRLHGTQRAALAAEPLTLDAPLPASPPTGRRVRVYGTWDRTAHVLLSGRTHQGAAGVSWCSVLRLSNGEGVLVERGWVPAADARDARLGDDAFTDTTVIGLALPLAPQPGTPPWVALGEASDSTARWSARALDPEFLAPRFRPPLVRWVVRALPDEAASLATRDRPPIAEPWLVADETMHLSYAVQWFAFALIVLVGGFVLARRR
jgi:surfeit locus 1 family protein